MLTYRKKLEAVILEKKKGFPYPKISGGSSLAKTIAYLDQKKLEAVVWQEKRLT